MRQVIISIFFWLLWAGPFCIAAEGKDKKDADKGESRGELFENLPPKTLSDSERKGICAKYRGKMVAFWSMVFQIDQDCHSHELGSEDLKNVARSRASVLDVTGDELQAFTQGASYAAWKTEKPRSCEQLNKHYASYLDVDVVTGGLLFYVENCALRRFPDLASFENHRGAVNAKAILSLNDAEYAKLKRGPDMPSVLDGDFALLLGKDPEIELVPIDEACKGLIGTTVSYLGALYMIEKIPGKAAGHCQKKPLDAEVYTKKNMNRTYHLRELSSAQHESIPSAR